MKHTQTQGDGETGLASLLEGTTPGPWMVAVFGEHLRPMVKRGSLCIAEPLLFGTGDKAIAQATANARLIAAAPALAASHAALVSVCAEVVGAFDSPGVVLPDWEPLFAALANARKALSDARNLTAGMEGGRK